MDRTRARARLEERHDFVVLGLAAVVAASLWTWHGAATGGGRDAGPRGHVYSAVELHRAIWQSPAAWYGREAWVRAVVRVACPADPCGRRGSDTPPMGFVDNPDGSLDTEPNLPLAPTKTPPLGFTVALARAFPFVRITRFGQGHEPSYYHVRFDRQHPCLTAPFRAWLPNLPDCPVARLLN